MSEVALGRIAGPFSSSPLENFKSTPLALREKSTPGKFRLLHNLSFPYNEKAVNLNIPKYNSTLQFASIEDAVATIAKSPGAFLAKADIAEAFRLLPLSPSCYNLTGFHLEGNFFFDKCLPMGASSACKIFERFSSSLKFILLNHYNVPNVIKVLDDFLFIAPSFAECNYALKSFQSLCSGINVPLALEKTEGL